MKNEKYKYNKQQVGKVCFNARSRARDDIIDTRTADGDQLAHECVIFIAERVYFAPRRLLPASNTSPTARQLARRARRYQHPTQHAREPDVREHEKCKSSDR